MRISRMLEGVRVRPQRGRRRRSRTSPWATAAIVFTVVAVVLVIGGLAVRNIRRQDTLLEWRRSLEPPNGRIAWPAWNPAWPPLPTPPRRDPFLGDLTGPYAFAARRADVLRVIPCYCGCRRIGHQSNAECYLKNARPDGMPVWSDHAFSCDLCVRITEETMLLLDRGLEVSAVRKAIDDHYQDVYPNPTLTRQP